MEDIVKMMEKGHDFDELFHIVEKLSNDDIGKLIAMGNKSTWPITIKIFNLLEIERWRCAIPDILKLQQDLNWPGTRESQLLLSKYDFIEYKEEFNNALKEAVCTNDGEWVENLIWHVLDNYFLNLLDFDLWKKCRDIFMEQAKS